MVTQISDTDKEKLKDYTNILKGANNMSPLAQTLLSPFTGYIGAKAEDLVHAMQQKDLTRDIQTKKKYDASKARDAAANEASILAKLSQAPAIPVYQQDIKADAVTPANVSDRVASGDYAQNRFQTIMAQQDPYVARGLGFAEMVANPMRQKFFEAKEQANLDASVADRNSELQRREALRQQQRRDSITDMNEQRLADRQASLSTYVTPLPTLDERVLDEMPPAKKKELMASYNVLKGAMGQAVTPDQGRFLDALSSGITREMESAVQKNMQALRTNMITGKGSSELKEYTSMFRPDSNVAKWKDNQGRVFEGSRLYSTIEASPNADWEEVPASVDLPKSLAQMRARGYRIFSVAGLGEEYDGYYYVQNGQLQKY